MGFPSVSRGTRKCNKTHLVRRFWEIGTRTFPMVCVLFSHPVIILWYTSSQEMHGFSYQFLIAWKDAAKPTLWGRPGIKIPIFSQSKATFLLSYSHRMVFYTTLKIHRFSHQFLRAWVNVAKFVLWEDRGYGNFCSTYHMVTAWNINTHVFLNP